MTQSLPRFACAVFVISSLALTACSRGPAFVPSANPYAHGVAVQTFAGDILATVPNIAGTYNGTFVETAEGKTFNGTGSFVLKQSGTKISGTATQHLLGRTHTYSVSGTVSKTAKGAAVKLTISNSKGTVSGHGTVIGKHFNGKASGGSPFVTITWKTVKA